MFGPSVTCKLIRYVLSFLHMKLILKPLSKSILTFNQSGLHSLTVSYY